MQFQSNLITNSNGPAFQYQRQRLIWNTVRVPSSLYTMNLGSLSSIQPMLQTEQVVEQAGTPYEVPKQTPWNQMSDRARPSNQVNHTPSGSRYHGSSTRHSIVRNRPGAMSPGGMGVDIKHNCYERYLNRLKGKSVLRRGPIPPTYGAPIPFSCADPIYGGKTVKTGILSSCGPLSCSNNNSDNSDSSLSSKANDLPFILLGLQQSVVPGQQVWLHYNKTQNQPTCNAVTKEWQPAVVQTVNPYTVLLNHNHSLIKHIYAEQMVTYDKPTCPVDPTLVERIIQSRTTGTMANDQVPALLGELDCNQLTLLNQNGLL